MTAWQRRQALSEEFDGSGQLLQSRSRRQRGIGLLHREDFPPQVAHSLSQEGQVDVSRLPFQARDAFHEFIESHLAVAIVDHLKQILAIFLTPNLQLHGSQPTSCLFVGKQFLKLLAINATVPVNVGMLEEPPHLFLMKPHSTLLALEHDAVVHGRHLHRLGQEDTSYYLDHSKAKHHLKGQGEDGVPFAHLLRQNARNWHPVAQGQLKHGQHGF
mmetsp:Transcript_65052/g.152250  ORF Transcript_65052/g.152250 Transcript_65052/m.152250 type:complete len:215 (+) Transcript_65052:75-719(+)